MVSWGPMPEENLEERLRELVQQAQSGEISDQELQEKADSEVRKALDDLTVYANDPNMSKEELSSRLQTIRDAEKVIRERIAKIEEEERRIALIEGPIQIILEYGEPSRRFPFQSKDKIIYAQTNGEKIAIFIASHNNVYQIHHLALSPDSKRLAFDCLSSWDKMIGFNTFRYILGVYRQLYVINTNGEDIVQIESEDFTRYRERKENYILEPQEILITHVSLHSPNWIDNETLKFKREVTTDREPNDPLRLILPETLEEDVYKARLDAHNKVVGELERIG